MVLLTAGPGSPGGPSTWKKVIINNIIHQKNFYYYLMPLIGYLHREYLLAHLSVPVKKRLLMLA